MSKKVQLVLKSSDISNLGYNNTTFAPNERTADVTTSIGFINRYQTKFIWYNINLRGILGSLYKKDGKYNMKLESIVYGLTSNLGGMTSIQNDLSWNIYMSGLPGLEGYSTQNGKTSEILLTSVRLPNGANQTIFTYSNNEISFELNNNNSSEICNINIEYRDLLTNLLEPSITPIVAYPHCQFLFSIYEIID